MPPIVCTKLLRLLALLAGLGLGGPAAAERLFVAAAANFQEPMRALAQRFEAESGHELVLSFASTGKHYAQIVHGAPFAVFFAADAEHPARLEREGRAVAGSRFTYAIGRLALWSPASDAPRALLEARDFRRLAIANPRLAPYGAAAAQTLQALSLWQGLQEKLVRGENITQTHQFVASGNAQLGFVALAQLREHPAGGVWEVPESLHAPLRQQAVLLQEGPAARALLQFMGSPAARSVIADYGYRVP